MRRAFDGSDIHQQQQLGQRQQGFPPRPQSAKVLMYNNLNQNNYGNEYIDDPANYSRNQINVRESSGAPSARGYQPQRQQSGGMKRQSSAHRNFENNALQANKPAPLLGKINQNVNNSFSDQKHMPKIISQDKEKLYADTLSLKTKVNELTEENLKIKTKLFQSERESGKLKKMLEQYEGNAVVKGQFPRTEGNSHITESLKKNVKDLRNDLQARDEEISQMKKQLKYTRVQELDIERKSFMEECQRLKQLLQQACNEKMQVLMQNKENTISYFVDEKETDFQKLEERTHLAIKEAQDVRAQNRDLQMEIQAMQNINSSLSQKSSEMLKKCQDQVFKLKQSSKEKDREIIELKNSLARLRGQPISKGAVSGMRPSSAKVGGKLFGEDLLQQKDQMIIALQQEVNRLQSQEKLKMEHSNELHNNRDDIESLNNRDLTMTNDKLRSQLANSNNNQELMENQEKLLESYGKGEITIEIRVTRVRREDILRIGEELQYKLRAQSLGENEAAQGLFDNLKATSSIRSLHGLFQENPFSLEPSKSLLFARYLVEEQTGEYGFSWDAERQNQAVFESFRDAVGTYKVFSTAYAKKLYDSLVEVFQRNRAGIKAALESREKQDGSVTKEDFLEAFELLGILLQKDQISFLIMAMILRSPGLDKLQYKEILKLFKGKHGEGANDNEDEEYENDENEYGYDKYLVQQQMNYPAENGHHEGIDEEEGEYYDDEDDEEIMEDNFVGQNAEKSRGRGGKNNFEMSEEQNKGGMAPEEYDRLLKQKEQEWISSWKDESDEEADKKGGKSNSQQQMKQQMQQQGQLLQFQQQQQRQFQENQQKEQQKQKNPSFQQDQKKNQQLVIEEHWEEPRNNRTSQQNPPNEKREEEEIVEVVDEERTQPQQQKAIIEANNYEEEFDIVSDDEQ